MISLIILTGVAGSGKTTIGEALAERLGYPFYDGDDFHPARNIAKMARGEPLDDADRAPWLQRLHDLLARLSEQDQPAVVACSALKEAYRRRLVADLDGVCFVYLHGDQDLILARLQARQGHYMPAALLQSQFDALEPPAPGKAIHVDVDDSVARVVARLVDALESRCDPTS